MSMYGPPGGQYPGQPSDPWQQNEPYGQPSGAPYPTSPYGPPDPWSAPPASPGAPGNQPGYGQPGYDQGYQQDPYAPTYGQQAPSYGQQAPGYGQQSAPPYGQQPDPFGQQPVWGAPTPPQKKRSVGGIVALIIVLVVVLCGGGITGLYFFGMNSSKPTAQNTPTPGISLNGNDPTDEATPTPEDSPTQDATDSDITTVRVGQCVVNTGTDSDAHLQIKACGKGTFKVLKRYDGVANKAKCDAIPESDYWYTYTTTPASDDFTLCLKEQK
jgi:hypothetical protein